MADLRNISDGLDLGPIEVRLRAATPGPWVYRESQSWIYGSELVSMIDGLGMRDAIVLAFGYSGDADMTTPGKEPSDENAEFIANAPTDITALIAEVKRLREVEETLRDRIDQMEFTCEH